MQLVLLNFLVERSYCRLDIYGNTKVKTPEKLMWVAYLKNAFLFLDFKLLFCRCKVLDNYDYITLLRVIKVWGITR